MTHEIEQALNAIDGAPGHVRRKRTTVLRVAQAQATEQPLTTVWAQPDCGSKGAWYGETRRGVWQPGWCDDPAVQAALVLAKKRADWYVDVRLGRAIASATDEIVEAAPAAAKQLVRMATQGVMQVRRNEASVEEPVNAPEVIKAINSVLDRADARTATKQPASVEHSLAPELMDALERAYGDVSEDKPISHRDEE
ncbi:MAG: hypothetical protein KAX65_07720 [Caldilineaceae bacterium]|nr:hypothetical protein [Caldilineaceae bacterium]